MTWRDYLASVDASHEMTTDPSHIAALCELAEGKRWRILELGSHAGISAAAISLAAPDSEVISVDLCDTIPQAARERAWASLHITNITPVAASAGDYLASTAGGFDIVFHDAVHGPAAMGEYLLCAKVASVVAIHDFEQLPAAAREEVASLFTSTEETADGKGRVLFVGAR
jgi:predicted O-methyltransferase YrrM